MKKAGMNRRQFLQASSAAVAGTAAAVGTGTLLVDPGGAWAMTLQAMNEHAAMTLLRMSVGPPAGNGTTRRTARLG